MIKTIMEKIKNIFQPQIVRKSPEKIASDMYLDCFISAMQAKTANELMESRRLIKEYSKYCMENKIPNKLEIRKLRDEFNRSYSNWKRRARGY